MSEIKHILYEDGAEEIFRLIVTSGNYAGTYDIVKPDGWDEVDSVVNISEEFFNVEDFIIGKTNKIKFLQYNDDTAYEVIKNVYREQGGDGQILFKWILRKDGYEYEPLGDNFEINLNKYDDGFEKSMMRIETEIKKRESQSKLLNREDVTINLFETKDIDGNDLTPVPTFEFGYKKGDKVLSNFWFFSTNQMPAFAYSKSHFFMFTKSDDSEFGSNTNKDAGEANYSSTIVSQKGVFLTTNVTLKKVIVEFSNIHWMCIKENYQFPNCSLVILVKNGVNVVRSIIVKDTVAVNGVGAVLGEIKITNQKIDIGKLSPGESLDFKVQTNEDAEFSMYWTEDNASIEITTNLTTPMVKTRGVRLFDAINQVVKNYTANVLSLESNILSVGGFYYNSSISTGIFLRGLPSIFTVSQKMKTSLKGLLYDSAAPLMALGFDILNDKVIVEDLDYFFKDVMIADLSDKEYLEENYKIENDKEISFNTLVFGSKKFSTQKKYDIENFNTKLEATTPLITVKKKFDKQTDFVIDEYKIQELNEDKSTSTNTNDDDLVLIDMVNLNDYWDDAVFEDCAHISDDGYLWLICTETPFDTTLLSVGSSVQIPEGLNIGTWQVLEINGIKIKLNKTTGIQTGTNDTPIKYLIQSVTKNRTTEGFTNVSKIRNPESCTNIRHNPKYHLSRWFRYFGSGLRRKPGTEKINVTSYKNNSEAKMEAASAELNNELQGLVTTGASETLSRLRGFQQTYFNGQNIEVTLMGVTHYHFLQIFNNWRYGIDGDRNKSRGFIKVPTPDGVIEVYPFADKAFEHSKTRNELSIKGKIRGVSVPNPILKSVEQINDNTVKLDWDYSSAYVNPEIQIQVSLDGVYYQTIKTISNVKTLTFSDVFFESVLYGTDVYFRILVDTNDFYHKTSNEIMADWQFNIFYIKEISRTENIDCGKSYLGIEIFGTGNFDIDWKFTSNPSGGSALVKEKLTLNTITSFTSPEDFGLYEDSIVTNHTIVNDILSIEVELKTTDSDSVNMFHCFNGGNSMDVNVFAELEITITETNSGKNKTIVLQSDVIKNYDTNHYSGTDPFIVP